MLSSYLVAALSAGILLAAAPGLADPVPSRVEIEAPAVVERAAALFTGSPSLIGCFSSDMNAAVTNHSDFQTQGNCQIYCVPEGGLLLAVNDKDCSCLTKVQASDKVLDSFCDTKCPGFGQVMCGGTGVGGQLYYSIWNAGVVDNSKIEGAVAAAAYTPSASSSTTKSTGPAATAPGGSSETIYVTPTAAAGSTSSGSNTAGIAAGVVVGVVAITAIVGGIFFYIRAKRRREVELEYQRQVAVSAFVNSGKNRSSNSSLHDNRLDPSFQRRMSDGSIADNQDYSRRILKVTNA